MSSRDPALRADLLRILRAGVDAVDPFPLTARALAARVSTLDDRVICIAAGKAAWPMARAAADVLGSRIRRGVVAGPRAAPRGSRRDVAGPFGVFESFDAAHPVPNDESERAGRRALALASSSRLDGGHLLVLLSGGASSLLAVPADGVTLGDKGRIAHDLMRSGADIAALNCVRKHLSAIKGGRLAVAAGRCLTLAISDVHVPADDPATIGSGPTVADPSTFADALDVVARSGIDVSARVRAHLEAGAAGGRDETLKPGDEALAASEFAVIANRRTAMAGAQAEAVHQGYSVHVIERPTVGEACKAGRAFAARALDLARESEPDICVIASGEPVVTVHGEGRGGRNQEFALGAAEVLHGTGVEALLASAATDGIDGPTDAAGAIVGPLTGARAADLGFSIRNTLAKNDSCVLLGCLGDLIVWGPTFTNVGDLHVFVRRSATSGTSPSTRS